MGPKNAKVRRNWRKTRQFAFELIPGEPRETRNEAHKISPEITSMVDRAATASSFESDNAMLTPEVPRKGDLGFGFNSGRSQRSYR